MEQKLTKEFIESKIGNVEYLPRKGTLTICIITMMNGFKVVGSSACLSEANFNAETGKNIAYSNAFDKLWELEGYAAL